MLYFASRIRASIYSLFILAGRIMFYRTCFVLYLIALVSCHFILSENPCLMYFAIYRTLVPPNFTQTVNNRVWVLSLASLSLYVCSLLCNWQVFVTIRPSYVGHCFRTRSLGVWRPLAASCSCGCEKCDTPVLFLITIIWLTPGVFKL